MPEVLTEKEAKVETAPRHKGDAESMAISLCVSAMEPLTADQTMRVLRYIVERYVQRLKEARAELDARIKIIEQHAGREACKFCRALPNTETPTEIGVTQ